MRVWTASSPAPPAVSHFAAGHTEEKRNLSRWKLLLSWPFRSHGLVLIIVYLLDWYPPGCPSRPAASEGLSSLGSRWAPLTSGQTWFDRRELFVIDDSSTYLQPQQSGLSSTAVPVLVCVGVSVWQWMKRSSGGKDLRLCVQVQKCSHSCSSGSSSRWLVVCASSDKLWAHSIQALLNKSWKCQRVPPQHPQISSAVALISAEKCQPCLHMQARSFEHCFFYYHYFFSFPSSNVISDRVHLPRTSSG